MRTPPPAAAAPLFAALLLATTPTGASPASSADAPSAPSPRIAMLWSPVRAEAALASAARHDLVVLGVGTLGLVYDRKPIGFAEGFTSASIEAARERMSELRRRRPGIVIVAEIYFYEWSDAWLPEDHPWWLRRDGQRQQFWPGTHRTNWYDAAYRARVAGWTASLQQAGVDGAFFDNLREEPEPWIALLTETRRRVGERFLLLANAGYEVGRHDFAAPFLNGFMYESGWSHGRTEWDATIASMQRTESLLREPRISVVERFEDTADRAGWPGDPRRGKKPRPDPAARRWSLCFALAIGDLHYLFADDTSHVHDWYPEYDVKIGRPAGPGERLGPHAWRRRYEKALVVVNLPGATRPERVDLGREATDTLTGERKRSFEIPPGDGRILLLR